MLLKEFLENYDNAVEFFLHEQTAKGRTKMSVKNNEAVLRDFRNFYSDAHKGEEEIQGFRYVDFQMWRDNMEEKGTKVSTIKQKFSLLNSFFNCVSDEELEDMRFYDKNPVPKRVKPTEDKEQRKPYQEILTDEQVSLLWENTPVAARGVKKANWPRNYAIVMTLLATEVRNKELLDLKLSDIDFEYKEIQIWEGKGNKYRCVDCPDIALDAIRLYLNSGLRPEGLSDDDYLFGTKSEKDSFGTFTKGDNWNRGSKTWLAELVRRHVKMITGVDNVRTHDLRHVGARLDLHNGMRAEELQAKLGHSKITTTQIYSGKLGGYRKRVTASGVYAERDYQAQRNKMMLENAG